MIRSMLGRLPDPVATWVARLGIVGLIVVVWQLAGWTAGLLFVGWVLGALTMAMYVALYPETAAEQFGDAMAGGRK